MSSNIHSISIGKTLLQSGEGVPTHSPDASGNIYVDTLTGRVYEYQDSGWTADSYKRVAKISG